MVERFSFFSACLRTFGAQAVRVQSVIFSMLHAPLTILESWTISDHIGPFQTIMDRNEPSWIILDNIGPWHNFRQFQPISDQFRSLKNHSLTISWQFSAISSILDHFLTDAHIFLTLSLPIHTTSLRFQTIS